ncbi:MAG: response regulator [Anaerolineae bacterium]|nr:response regulator [Anaerolineae bacterium]
MSEAREPHSAGVPDRFIEQVKQILEHLYDFPYLQRHPLAQGTNLGINESPAQRLRRETLTAIETLSPGPGVTFRAPHARLHSLLHFRYVEGLTVQEAAHELGISLRQAYRDLRHGEESIAAILWDRYAGDLSQEPRADQLSSIEAEVERLDLHPDIIDMQAVLLRTQNAVRQLALQRNIELESTTMAENIVIQTDEVIAQQVLTSILSHAIQQATPGRLTTSFENTQTGMHLCLCYTPTAEAGQDMVSNLVVSQLLDRLGWSLKQEDDAANRRVISVVMVGHGPTILVIDDNEGLVDLVGRYLSSHACRVISATSGEEGLRVAQDIIPDAILLDVMMPQKDGWEVLQTLHTYPQTTSIPVIICSVFNDPELAYSLGASLFLPKPIQRDGILNALHDLGVV